MSVALYRLDFSECSMGLEQVRTVLHDEMLIVDGMAAFLRALALAVQQGAEVEELDVPLAPLALPFYASAVLCDSDGLRWELRMEEPV